jgi:hypothetical protein
LASIAGPSSTGLERSHSQTQTATTAASTSHTQAVEIPGFDDDDGDDMLLILEDAPRERQR